MSSSANVLPIVSSVPAIRPADQACHVWNDHLFSKLRASLGLADDFINSGWKFEDLAGGTGKGGAKMVFVGSKYIVKELDQNDHDTLLSITASLVEHLVSGDSLVCRILLHFGIEGSGEMYMVMRNEVGGGPFDSLWDLKGCADDKALVLDGESLKVVHKRIWKVHMWVGRLAWNKDREKYHDGKMKATEVTFSVPEKRKDFILKALRRDTDWLQREGLMDYSLLVGVSGSGNDGKTTTCGKVIRCFDETCHKSLEIVQRSLELAGGACQKLINKAASSEEGSCCHTSVTTAQKHLDHPHVKKATGHAKKAKESCCAAVLPGLQRLFQRADCPKLAGRCGNEETDDGGVRVGIIDFLQKWTTAKKMASALKALETNKATVHPDAYAERFHSKLHGRFVVATATGSADGDGGSPQGALLMPSKLMPSKSAPSTNSTPGALLTPSKLMPSKSAPSANSTPGGSGSSPTPGTGRRSPRPN
eukprot:TRINITY_DN5963_c0_g1_i1.p1 TRINITY_DN5963_c0_g1~~TRINITY_DN5963_c0_g1_i1.p1  ORF type:complete len:477 (+),score=95.98 TRINITY_DN5963_c0_g1_i1:124-1554(+)